MEERRKGCSVAAEAPPPLLGLVVVAVLPPPGYCTTAEDLEGMSRRRCALSPRCCRLELAAELLHSLQAVASPLISSSPSPLITMVVSSVTSSKFWCTDIKSGHGFVVGDEGCRQDSDIQKVKLSREALTQLSKLVESRVSTGLDTILTLFYSFWNWGCYQVRLNTIYHKSSICISRGCGWQHLGPFINLGAFYLCGISLAATLAFWVKLRGKELWIGMTIFSKFKQHPPLLPVTHICQFAPVNYGIKRNWQGDPCIPLSYMWDGVNCSYAASAIFNLKSIGYLDLSNNILTGSVPYFLSQFHSLKVLNLEGNHLTGAVPMQLRENSNNGMLKTSFGGNQGLCYSGSCSNSNKVVVPLVASLGGVASEMGNLRAYSRIKMELESNKQQFSYVEVQKITKNFKRVVGKGASGTVYHGYVGDTEVAVKMLSPSDSNSAQAYLQFQALFTQ
ncbi:hypothetical protein Ahy_B05g077820 [Arachis hypogaea]|uniref:Protein kinase domain-containing protein n=1 Tax=Arachis hypogaea TaxID=3818 RepID=A0A444Z5M4_ARAHY|nr:hypothetical protein Ahy_B05g077820 [Arachis hypogaea]